MNLLNVIAASRRRVVPSGSLTGAYLTDLSSDDDLSEYTFSDVALGSAAATRHIIVAVPSRGTGTMVPTAVTVGGVSATKDIEYVGNTDGNSIWRAAVPTGSTGDIVVTCPFEWLRIGLAIYRVDAAGIALHSSLEDTRPSNEDYNGSINVAADSFLIVSQASRDRAYPSPVFSGLDTDVAKTVEILNYSSGSKSIASANASYSFTVHAYGRPAAICAVNYKAT